MFWHKLDEVAAWNGFKRKSKAFNGLTRHLANVLIAHRSGSCREPACGARRKHAARAGSIVAAGGRRKKGRDAGKMASITA